MIPQEDKNELTEMLLEKGIWFKPSIEIRVDRLSRIPLMEFEANNHDGAYNQVRRAMKPVANYGWDNSILRVSNIFGEEFSMAVYLTKNKGVISHWEITLWDYKGTTTVGVWKKEYKGDDDKLTIEELKAIKERLEEFSHEVLHCSACQTTMPTNRRIKFNSDVHKKEYGGQYFAGHYCTDCWESKYKAIEARETYE